MNKRLQLPIDIKLVHHPGQDALILSFRREALNDWCLGLCLLKEGLIETLAVTGERRKMSVEIGFGAKPEASRVVRATLRSDTSVVEITNNDLDRLQHFFLRYYRDGVADVDHLDIDAISAATGNRDVYITFRVPDSRPPVGPKEAKERLRGAD
jgi:hypothetical protein